MKRYQVNFLLNVIRPIEVGEVLLANDEEEAKREVLSMYKNIGSVEIVNVEEL